MVVPLAENPHDAVLACDSGLCVGAIERGLRGAENDREYTVLQRSTKYKSRSFHEIRMIQCAPTSA
jgi:hypothetical protein